MSSPEEILEGLVALSRDLGKEERRMAILGEGNTSADIGDGTFWVKASGSQLGTAAEKNFSRVKMDAVFELMEDRGLTNEQINTGLEATCVSPEYKRPSIETFLHALCLKEGGAKWVGHTHADSICMILCSVLGAKPFMRHVYPDVVVVCGRHLAVIPYVDPGLQLAYAVRDELLRFRAEYGRGPKLLLMENHGPVALGSSAQEVFNIMLMADKWARVLLATYSLGGPAFLSEEDADLIDGRSDEAYRRKQLGA